MGFVMGTILKLCKGYNPNHPTEIFLGVHPYCVIFVAWGGLE